MVIPATIYSTRSSEARTVQLTFTKSTVEINDRASVECFLLSNIDWLSPLGNLPHEIRLPNGALITIDNHHKLAPFFGNNKLLISRLEQHKLFWLVALLLVPICLYVIIEQAIPAAAKSVTPLVPEQVLNEIDQQVMSILDNTLLDPSLLKENEKLSLTGYLSNERYSSTLLLENYTLSYRYSESFGANAFALPGGSIVVTDGLYTLLKDDQQALIAVLLHEIGHVEHQHGLQLIAETAATTLLMTYFFGDMEGIVETFTGTALTVIQNKFSQQLEKEADAFAVEQLINLGISPQALGKALAKLVKNKNNNQLLEKYFSSHPSLKDRVEFANSKE
jgi:Zn-dependent protease with chaperone function